MKSEFRMLASLKKRCKLFFLISCLAHKVLCGQKNVHGMGRSFLDVHTLQRGSEGGFVYGEEECHGVLKETKENKN